MKKSELKVGEAYAIGPSGRFDRYRAVRGVVVELDGTRVVRAQWRRDGVERRGIVVRFAAGERPVMLPNAEAVMSDDCEVLLGTAVGVRELWESFAARRDAHEEQQQAKLSEEGRCRGLAEVAVEALGSRFGLRWPAVVVDKGDVKFSADAITELLRRADPGDVAGGAVEMFVEELERGGYGIGKPEEGVLLPEFAAAVVSAAKDAAVTETLQGVAVSDAEIA